jgi:anti-sigma factor RsiW
MTCREFIGFLMEYQSGNLPPVERQVFDRHVGGCPACRAYLDNYRKTIEMGRAAFQGESEPLPPEVPEELIRAILTARGKS